MFSALTDTLTLCPCACCVQSQNGTRYVRVEHSGQYLHMQQVQVYVQSVEDNVALASLGATASSSTQQSGGVPERAIDGDVNKAANWPNSCHTKNGANEWWAVDLQREYVVTKIIVHTYDSADQEGLPGRSGQLWRPV